MSVMFAKPLICVDCPDCGFYTATFGEWKIGAHVCNGKWVEDQVMSKANDRQEGGTHYRMMAIQPWDFIAANGIGYFEGSAISYLARWKEKGGIQDLRKAVHYIEKLIEQEEGKTIGNR